MKITPEILKVAMDAGLKVAPDYETFVVAIANAVLEGTKPVVESVPQVAEPKRYTIGEFTKKLVFETSGLTDLSDLQAVLNAVEGAFVRLNVTRPDPSDDAKLLENLERIVLSLQNPGEYKMCYTNNRGKTAVRSILPKVLWFGGTPWHTAPQFILKAFDYDRGSTRDFAVKDFNFEAEPMTQQEAIIREATDSAPETRKDNSGDIAPGAHAPFMGVPQKNYR